MDYSILTSAIDVTSVQGALIVSAAALVGMYLVIAAVNHILGVLEARRDAADDLAEYDRDVAAKQRE